ncbi:MAG: hypothetical protein CML33_04975 [Rhodobacteraceae bacterium]|nr:hypothetical protein [Paracoccaceae bacterium]
MKVACFKNTRTAANFHFCKLGLFIAYAFHHATACFGNFELVDGFGLKLTLGVGIKNRMF